MPETVVIKGKGRTAGFFKEYLRCGSGESPELWTLNDDIQPETVRHFDLHLHNENSGLIKAVWLNSKRLFCYIPPTATPEHSWQCQYPLEALKIGSQSLDLTAAATPSYMIALAIHLGARRIFLAGCDFGGNPDERKPQKDCAERWICYGLGKGVEFRWPEHQYSFFVGRKNYV